MHSDSTTSLSPPSSFSSASSPRPRSGSAEGQGKWQPSRRRVASLSALLGPELLLVSSAAAPERCLCPPRRARRPPPRRRGCSRRCEVRGLRQGLVFGTGGGLPALRPRGAPGEEGPRESPSCSGRPGLPWPAIPRRNCSATSQDRNSPAATSPAAAVCPFAGCASQTSSFNATRLSVVTTFKKENWVAAALLEDWCSRPSQRRQSSHCSLIHVPVQHWHKSPTCFHEQSTSALEKMLLVISSCLKLVLGWGERKLMSTPAQACSLMVCAFEPP